MAEGEGLSFGTVSPAPSTVPAAARHAPSSGSLLPRLRLCQSGRRQPCSLSLRRRALGTGGASLGMLWGVPGLCARPGHPGPVRRSSPSAGWLPAGPGTRFRG